MNVWKQDNVVVLTAEERAEALRLGHFRHNKSEADGRIPDWYDGSEARNHSDGVGAEMAHCKYLGIPFEFRIDTFKAPDVGDNTEVRSTRSTWFGLKVKDRDKDERIVVAYRQLSDRVYVALGWLTAKEAKLLGEKKDPLNRNRPAYFVKDSQLHPMATLPIMNV